MLENFGSQGRNLALDRMKVLDGDRDSFQWPQTSVAFGIAPLGVFGLLARTIKKGRRQGIDLGIDLFTACNNGIHELDRRQLFGPESLHSLRGRHKAQVLIVGGHTSYPLPTLHPIKSFRIAACTSPTDATAKTASPS